HDVDEYRQALKAGKVRAEQTNRAWSIRIVLEEMLRIQGIFVNMKWSLLEAHDAYFLTSDCPVGIQPSPHDAGSLEFFFPVSRKYCLCGRTGGGEGKLLGSDEEVLGINRALISQADRFVFSPVNSPYIQETL